MSEYEAITEALAKAFQQHKDYEDEGRQFALRLHAAIQKYLGVPPGQLESLPPEHEEEGTKYTVTGAVELGDDAYFRMRVRVRCPGNYFFSIPFKFKKKDAMLWEVSIRADEASQLVSSKMEEDFENLVRDFAQGMKKELRTTFDEFLSGAGRRGKRMGFGVS